MDASLLVCGGSSFIARALLERIAISASVATRHDDLGGLAKGKTVVVNMLTDPRIKNQRYGESFDMDLKAARAALDADAHFVMLSTRKVYGSRPGHLVISDDVPPNPNCYYGENKLTSEQAVLELLGDRATILRITNVVGYEPGRPTFFGIALTRLKNEGKIVLDVSPSVRRDFLPVNWCADLLAHAVTVQPPGIYPFGAGSSVSTGQVCDALISGFGGGRIEVVDDRLFDGFSLASSKHNAVFGQFLNLDPTAAIQAVGRQLREQHA